MKKIIKFLTIFFLTLIIQAGQGFFTQNENKAFADFSFRDMELSFVQISDTHISDREDTSYKALSNSKLLLEDAIKQVNDIKMLDFVMFTGDMVDEPLKKSYRDFFILLTKLKYPPLMTFGNHDARQIEILDKNTPPYIDKNEALNIIKKCNPYYIFDNSYYAFSPKNDYRVIVLDTTVDDAITANGKLKDEQAEFLKSELEANQDKVIVIFQHHPVAEPFKSEHHKITNGEEYMDIIKQYKKTPIAIFSGHYHAAKIMRQGNIIHVSTPSLVTFPNEFRYVNITNYKDRTIFNIKYMETNLEDVQKQSKLSAIASATLRGLPNDHNIVITIRKNKNYDNDLKEEKPKTIKEDKELQKEAAKNKKAEDKAAKKASAAEAKAKKAEEKAIKEAENNALKAKKAEEKAELKTQKQAQNEAKKELRAKEKQEKEQQKLEKQNKEAELRAERKAAKAETEAKKAQERSEKKAIKEAAKTQKKESATENAGN